MTWIGRELAEEKLLAFANTVAGIAWIYRWQDKFCEDAETTLFAKTKTATAPALAECSRYCIGSIAPMSSPYRFSAVMRTFLDWVVGHIN